VKHGYVKRHETSAHSLPVKGGSRNVVKPTLIQSTAWECTHATLTPPRSPSTSGLLRSYVNCKLASASLLIYGPVGNGDKNTWEPPRGTCWDLGKTSRITCVSNYPCESPLWRFRLPGNPSNRVCNFTLRCISDFCPAFHEDPQPRYTPVGVSERGDRPSGTHMRGLGVYARNRF
jgi:hypothetical protein